MSVTFLLRFNLGSVFLTLVTSAPPHAIANRMYGLLMCCKMSESAAISVRHWLTASSTAGSFRLSRKPSIRYP